MTRSTTTALDAQILALLESGLKPKEVAAKLGLKNKWHVYNTRRRNKGAGEFTKNSA